MRFGTKLTLALVGPIIVALVAYAYLDEHRTRQRIREELRREGRAVARTAQISIEDALRDRQLEDITDLVDQITGFERVFGFRTFDGHGNMIYQSAPLADYPFRNTEALKGVLRDATPYESQRSIEDHRVLTYMYPLTAPDGSVVGAVQLLQLESFMDEEIRAARNAIVFLTLAVVLVTGATVTFMTHSVVGRPVRRFVAGIRGIRPGDSGARLPIQGSFELRNLAQEFNDLLGRLDVSRRSLLTEQEERRQAEFRVRNAERLAALGRLAAGLAHEIGTPLHVIAGRTELLQRRHLEGEALDRNIRIISEQIDRIARIVSDVLEFARVKEPNLTPTEVPGVLSHVLEFLEHRLQALRVEVSSECAAGVTAIAADADQLYEVFLNLILNAADAMPEGGKLAIRTDVVRAANPETHTAEAEFVRIRFQDEGEGVSPENLERVFDPFFTTKPMGKGTGLGMSVSYGIVREHGGWIEMTSQVGEGSTVTVYLPVRAEARAVQAVAS